MEQEIYRSVSFKKTTKELAFERLRQKAIQLWSLNGVEIEQLDPVVDLLLGACAAEFERTAQDLEASQSRVLERLAQIMVPEVFSNARPAHSIIKAQPEGFIATVKIEEEFCIEKEIQSGEKKEKETYTFSPLVKSKLFDASISLVIHEATVCIIEDALIKKEIFSGIKSERTPTNTVWIGIKCKSKWDHLKGFSLFIDFKTEGERNSFLPLVGLTQLFIGEKQLNTISKVTIEKEPSSLDAFDPLQILESYVLNYYNNNFLTFSEDITTFPLSVCPPEMQHAFSENQIKELKEELLWIKAVFADVIPSRTMREMTIANNCFPVVNRKLYSNHRPYSLKHKINSIPLELKDHFLAMGKVYSSSCEYGSISIHKLKEMKEGSYALRNGGMHRFDKRDGAELLNYLYNVVRDENAAFSTFGHTSLNTEIKNLDLTLNRLEKNFLEKLNSQAENYHLLINAKEPEDVWLEYWTTQGEKANALPIGTKAETSGANPVKKNTAILMRRTGGGKDPLDKVEKVLAYKQSLLSRNRIVTMEDIKAACYARLGKKIQGVNIKKGIKKNSALSVGFERTLDVFLIPAKGFEEINWEEECDDLKLFVERNKGFMTEIQVFNTKAETDAIRER